MLLKVLVFAYAQDIRSSRKINRLLERDVAIRYLAANNAYFQWRRNNQIREEYSEREIVDALADTIEEIEAYRTQLDAQHPDEVSLVGATDETWGERIKVAVVPVEGRYPPPRRSSPTSATGLRISRNHAKSSFSRNFRATSRGKC